VSADRTRQTCPSDLLRLLYFLSLTSSMVYDCLSPLIMRSMAAVSDTSDRFARVSSSLGDSSDGGALGTGIVSCARAGVRDEDDEAEEATGMMTRRMSTAATPLCALLPAARLRRQLRD
jgi:hypothetical protein